MGDKGVSKRKAKALKPKTQDAAANPIVDLSKETTDRIPRTVRKGQAITSGKGGKEKYSHQPTTNKKK